MNNEIAQMELDMPQLRQMVLENTERINRNELIVNEIKLDEICPDALLKLLLQ